MPTIIDDLPTPGSTTTIPVPQMRWLEPVVPVIRSRGLLLFSAGAALGLAAALLADPQSGRRRRHVARDRTLAAGRRALRRTARSSRYARSTVEGKRQAFLHRNDEPDEPLNDPTLANKVRSELFRDPHVPKGDINVMVQEGIVLLHGRVEDARLVRELVDKARSVQGVVDVESHLHVMSLARRHNGTAH